jgi:hypothetical protein
VDTTHILKIQTELAQRTLEKHVMSSAKSAEQRLLRRRITTHRGVRRTGMTRIRVAACAQHVIDSDSTALRVDG